jgi:cell wall-associated NlpC family hydrolase
MTVMAVGAPSALAGGTGGVAAVEPPSSVGGSSSTTPAPAHAAPVTAKSSKLSYKGPIYEKTAAGAIVPYEPTSTTATAAGTAEPSSVATSTGASTPSPGGAVVETSTEAKPELLVPGTLARYVDGLAAAPESAPAAVQEMIWAGNQLIGLPYIYGGGHNATFTSPGYDCSGTVSFALHGADLLTSPLDSGEFMTWGAAGVGQWVTIFTNPGHAYMTVAGLRLDTSSADDPSNEQGPRWRPLRQSNAGFTVRHPLGL